MCCVTVFVSSVRFQTVIECLPSALYDVCALYAKDVYVTYFVRSFQDVLFNFVGFSYFSVFILCSVKVLQ